MNKTLRIKNILDEISTLIYEARRTYVNYVIVPISSVMTLDDTGRLTIDEELCKMLIESMENLNYSFYHAGGRWMREPLFYIRVSPF